MYLCGRHRVTLCFVNKNLKTFVFNSSLIQNNINYLYILPTSPNKIVYGYLIFLFEMYRQF